MPDFCESVIIVASIVGFQLLFAQSQRHRNEKYLLSTTLATKIDYVLISLSA